MLISSAFAVLIIHDLTRIKHKNNMTAHMSDYDKAVCHAVDEMGEGTVRL